MSITKLPEKWRRYENAYAIAEAAYLVLANELEDALPVWTRITDDPDTWPKTERGLFFMLAGLEDDGEKVWQVITDFLDNDYDGCTHWRPLCDIDYPPDS